MDLPTQFPDLNTLFERMPGFAALQAGNMSRIADQNNQSLQDAFKQKEAFEAQKRPLDLEHLTAQTNGLNATTRKLNNENTVDEATQESTIGAKNTVNKTKISQGQLDDLDQMGQLFGQISARMSGVPPLMRADVAKRMLAGHIKDNPELDQLLVGNADALPKHFKALADSVYTMSKKAREEQMRESRELEKIRLQGENMKDVSRINAQGKIDAKNAGGKKGTTDAELVSKLGYEKAAVYYDAKATDAEASGDDDKAELYRTKASMFKMAREREKMLAGQAGQAGKPDISQMGVPTNPAIKPEGFTPLPQNAPTTLQDLKKHYPGKTDEELKAAYKRKYGKDIQ